MAEPDPRSTLPRAQVHPHRIGWRIWFSFATHAAVLLVLACLIHWLPEIRIATTSGAALEQIAAKQKTERSFEASLRRAGLSRRNVDVHYVSTAGQEFRVGTLVKTSVGRQHGWFYAGEVIAVGGCAPAPSVEEFAIDQSGNVVRIVRVPTPSRLELLVVSQAPCDASGALCEQANVPMAQALYGPFEPSRFRGDALVYYERVTPSVHYIFGEADCGPPPA